MKAKGLMVWFVLFLLLVPMVSYAATVTVSQSGADSGSVMKGRTFNIDVSGLSGAGTVNLLDLPSGFSTQEGTSKSFSDGTTSVTWTTAQISQTQNDVTIKANVIVTGSPSTAESSSFNVVLPPALSFSVTPSSYTNVASGTSKSFSLSLQNSGGTSAKSVVIVVSGAGASITSGCDTVSSIAASGSSSGTCSVSFTQSGTATFTATPSNADSKSDTVSITVPGSGSSSSGSSSSGSSSGGGGPGILPPKAADKNETEGNQGKGDDKQDGKVNASRRPELVPGVGLKDNEKLKAALEKVLAKGKMSDKAVDNMLRLSGAITSDMDTVRDFDATNVSSNIRTKIKYNGARKIANFVVYEKIPKSFAESVDNITVITEGNVEVVERDPEYAVVFSEFSPGQQIEISYTVNQKVDASVIDEVASEVYAESMDESGLSGQEGMSLLEKILYALVVIIIIAVVVAVGYYLRYVRAKKSTGRVVRPVPRKKEEPKEEKPEQEKKENEEPAPFQDSGSEFDDIRSKVSSE